MVPGLCPLGPSPVAPPRFDVSPARRPTNHTKCPVFGE
jgi:hypothetical protein